MKSGQFDFKVHIPNHSYIGPLMSSFEIINRSNIAF